MSDRPVQLGERRRFDGETLTREVRIERAAAHGPIEVSISSDTPIPRVGWLGDSWFEILDHAPASVRLARLQDGGPLLLEHDRIQQLGVFERVRLERGRIRGELRFSRAPRAQEIEADVRDGIRTKLSVGYRVFEVVLERIEDGVETWRVTDWEPLEGSIVSIPADLSVGVGRSDVHQPAAAAAEERRTMTAPQPPATPRVDVSETQAERDRVKHLRQLCRLHQLDDTRIDRWINDGVTIEQASREILEAVRANPPRPTTTPGNGGDPLGLSEREEQQYSIVRAIRQHLPKSEGGLPPGFESEVSEALHRQLPEGYQDRGGLKVPTAMLYQRVARRVLRAMYTNLAAAGMLTRAGLDTLTATKGQEAVFTMYGGDIELLRSRVAVLALGGRYFGSLQGNVAFVKQTAAAVAEWMPENPPADVSDTELALALVTLTPKTLMASTFYTRQLARQNSVGIEQKVEDDLFQIHARGIDRAAIHGTGADNQPEGIYVASGVNPVAFGGAITYPKVVEMETAIAEADADVMDMGYLTTPGIRGAAKTTLTFPGVNAAAGRPIWTGGVMDGEMNGYRAMASTQVRTDLGPTPTPTPLDDHGLIFGVWPFVYVGEWGVFELVVDPYTKKKRGLIEVTSFQMADIQLAQPQAFSKATGLTLT